MVDSYQRRSDGKYIATIIGGIGIGVAITLGVTHCNNQDKRIKSLEDEINKKCKPQQGSPAPKPKPVQVKPDTLVIKVISEPCPDNLEGITNQNTGNNDQYKQNNNGNAEQPKKKGLFNRKRFANNTQYDGELKTGDTFWYEDKFLRYDGGSTYGHPTFQVISVQANMGAPLSQYHNMSFVRGSLFPGFVGNLNAQVFMNYNMGRLNNINMMYNSGFMNVEVVGNSLHSTTMPNYYERRINAFRMFGQ